MMVVSLLLLVAVSGCDFVFAVLCCVAFCILCCIKKVKNKAAFSCVF